MKNAMIGGLLIALSVGLYAIDYPSDWKPTEKTIQILQTAGKNAGLPIGLAQCVAYEESRFTPWVTGRGGKDRGLLQINSEYEVYLADKFFHGGHKAFQWWNATDSATLGCNYLAYLIEYFGGSVYLGLCAYNFGPVNLKNIKTWDDIPKITIKYADNILNNLDTLY